MFAAMLALIPLAAFANDAETLPEGVFRISQNTGYAWSTNQFGQVFGSGTVPITKDYNIDVYLSDLDPSFIGNDSFCSDPQTGKQTRCRLGKVNFDLLQQAIQMQTSLFYGITDKWTVGVIFPYTHTFARYSLSITGSNMGINYIVDKTTGKPTDKIDPNTPLGPATGALKLPGVRRPVTVNGRYNDVNTIFTAPEFGFEYNDPLNMREGTYLNDIIFGTRYNFYNNPWVKNSLTVFVITPTGQQKDYELLFSPFNGDGQLDVGFWFNNDFAVDKRRTFVIDFSLGYTTQFPQKKHFRTGSTSRNAQNLATNGTQQQPNYFPNNQSENFLPIGSKAGNYLDFYRDIGDNVDFFLGFRWEFVPFMSLSQEFYYYWKWRDEFELTYQPYVCELVSQVDHDAKGSKYCGEPGADFSQANVSTHALSLKTDREEVVSTTAITFSTLPFVQAGKFPVPLFLTAGFKASIAGKNIEQSMAVFFNVDIVGHYCIFKGNCDQLGKEEEKKTALGGPGMGYSLGAAALSK